MATVLEVYQTELKARAYAGDSAQLRAIESLDRCASDWTEYKEQRSNALKKIINKPDIPKGVYLYLSLIHI